MPHQNYVAITINLTSELSDYPFVLFLERRVSKSRLVQIKAVPMRNMTGSG